MLKWINKKRNKKGFTLIELVVVIAILGILGAIAVPRLGAFRETAEVRAGESTARILESGAQMYYAENGSFPEESGWFDTLTGDGGYAEIEEGAYNADNFEYDEYDGSVEYIDEVEGTGDENGGAED